MTSDDWQQSLAAVAADYLSRAHFLAGLFVVRLRIWV
jgi:hypothetical protein